MVETFKDYYEAQEAAEARELGVGGAYKGGKAIYFLHSRSASDDELRDLSFEAVNGRPMSTEERRLLEFTMDHHPEAFEVDSP